MNFSCSAKLSEGGVVAADANWSKAKPTRKSHSKNTMIVTHRNCYFVPTINIMYTLSWKGRGETVRILFDSEDSAKIWDEFFVFSKAE